MSEPTPAQLVELVKEYARVHYEDGGWDVIVECYEDADIARLIEGKRSLGGAIQALRPLISVWADRQADAINSAF